jgi:hypothetical protein
MISEAGKATDRISLHLLYESHSGEVVLSKERRRGEKDP